MNNAASSDCTNSRRYFVNFNQDCTSLAVGSQNGYRLFALNNSIDALEQIYNNTTEDSCIVERLFSSSLVAVVSISTPRKLQVCHFKKGTQICNYSYSNTILGVKLNRARLVVCMIDSICIHNIRDMKVLHTIRDTPRNPQGLCALSTNNEHCYLAYPGSLTVGEVQIFDVMNLQAKTMIPAHESPVAALAFSPSGIRIATASEKGTVIRVFSVVDGSKVFEFRRGMKRCVAISSLVFSMCSGFLACSSNTETVHVFKLEETSNADFKRGDDSSWMGYLSTYLPTQVSTVLSQGRAFSTAHLPVSGVRNCVGITVIQNQLRLLVATEDGVLYVYNIDPNEGGDLSLKVQHRLDGGMEETSELDSVSNRTTTEHVNVEAASGSTIGSYAGVLKGNPIGQMSDSEKFREMAAATESPPKGGFQFNDDQEYPPLTQKTD
ncbi:WD repeat domain phosphoinositide-interacting protein 2 isoform X2 [Onthophagus taurus]|uniref:WD repeat domain phosphoinositide-interacting protein 2 isoform X2 n=1 Tax=Onthophagus taurus TaxID=166361 RepID=UPI000C207FFD|nr:WD repeat domain phosphoinositide-interacting protein 2 isoform X2 [Onthophagus taurus]